MQTFWSADHWRHAPASELIDGHVAAHVEVPARAELVLDAVQERLPGEVIAVKAGGTLGAAQRAAVTRVHDERFVAFLEAAWDEWLGMNRSWDALPLVWPARSMRDVEPLDIDGRLGYWSFDAGTPITAGTWEAVSGSATTALAAADHVARGSGHAFALCRPPGHHAAAGAYGGYCYLNNSAVAAQALREAGASRVAVLDVDYHHGNGTQSIFEARGDVLAASIHADPRHEYPYFAGHADERGVGDGEGATANYPLPIGTGFDAWMAACDDACRRVTAFRPDALVVPLGVDTYVGDPISRFRLESADFVRMGARLAVLDLPTVVVMEGGYATDAIGTNVTNVLLGLAGA